MSYSFGWFSCSISYQKIQPTTAKRKNKKNYDESKIYDVVKWKYQGVEMENKHIQQTDFIFTQTQTERIVAVTIQYRGKIL